MDILRKVFLPSALQTEIEAANTRFSHINPLEQIAIEEGHSSITTGKERKVALIAHLVDQLHLDVAIKCWNPISWVLGLIAKIQRYYLAKEVKVFLNEKKTQQFKSFCQDTTGLEENGQYSVFKRTDLAKMKAFAEIADPFDPNALHSWREIKDLMTVALHDYSLKRQALATLLKERRQNILHFHKNEFIANLYFTEHTIGSAIPNNETIVPILIEMPIEKTLQDLPRIGMSISFKNRPNSTFIPLQEYNSGKGSAGFMEDGIRILQRIDQEVRQANMQEEATSTILANRQEETFTVTVNKTSEIITRLLEQNAQTPGAGILLASVMACSEGKLFLRSNEEAPSVTVSLEDQNVIVAFHIPKISILPGPSSKMDSSDSIGHIDNLRWQYIYDRNANTVSGPHLDDYEIVVD